MDDLTAYFHNFVVSAYLKYRETKYNGAMGNGDDKRDALNAAVALYHFREHLAKVDNKKRENLENLNTDYALCGDLANLAKHSKLDRTPKHNPPLSNWDNIYEVFITTRFKDSLGEFDNAEKLVEVLLDDGSTRDVFDVLTSVVNMWQDELFKIGALKANDPFIYQIDYPIPREKAKNVALAMTQGVKYEQKFKFQRYNYEKNVIEPVDLSSSKEIIFTVRKPKTFTLTLHSEKGEELTEIVNLSPEESVILNQIEDEPGKNKYLLSLAESKGYVKKMLNTYRKNLPGSDKRAS